MRLTLKDKQDGSASHEAVGVDAEKFLIHATDLGSLYQADCLDILPCIPDESIDTVFADPPFNLKKEYGSQVNDARSETDYVDWCKVWLQHCVRVLKPGGAMFVYNLPKWNIILGAYLNEIGMTFDASPFKETLLLAFLREYPVLSEIGDRRNMILGLTNFRWTIGSGRMRPSFTNCWMERKK